MDNQESHARNDDATLIHHGALQIKLPQAEGAIDQDAEYCSVFLDNAWQDVRFHDYDKIYRIPGLYEQLFHDILDCRSPDVIGKLLKEALQQGDFSPANLRVLDLGAGNGLVGEQLRNIEVGYLVGVDIIPEAKEAAERDRPRVYDAYHVLDMINLPEDMHRELTQSRFNTLSCVAALGYADIPPAAFRAAFNLISDGGWITFNIKDRFLSDDDTSGFAGLIRRCREEGILDLLSSQRYEHRRSVRGEPLHYVGLVGTKRAAIPADFVR